MSRLVLVAVIVAGSVLAVATLQPGLDYFVDPSASVDALVRGDLSDFFAEQPLMGSLSLLLRAPFVALVFGSSIDAVYFIGVIPCLLALVALVYAVLRRMDRAGRPAGERALVALVCLGSLMMTRAIHWGHPEELLGAALAVGAVLAAGTSRPVLAGILLGAAFGTKQWALLAALPALLALPARRGRFVTAATLTGAALVLPMLIGDPERFLTVMRAAGSVDPSYILGIRGTVAPGAHVTPFDVFWPLGSSADFAGVRLSFMNEGVARLAHPLILLVGLALPCAVWRRSKTTSVLSALQLLALVFALRGLLDPMSLDYYHLPLIVALGACAAEGGRRELDVALLATAGLTLAFAAPAASVAEMEQHGTLKWLAYLATMLPLTVWLARQLYAPRRLGDTKRLSRRPAADASITSARRLSRVSGRLAEAIQKATVLR